MPDISLCVVLTDQLLHTCISGMLAYSCFEAVHQVMHMLMALEGNCKFPGLAAQLEPSTTISNHHGSLFACHQQHFIHQCCLWTHAHITVSDFPQICALCLCCIVCDEGV